MNPNLLTLFAAPSSPQPVVGGSSNVGFSAKSPASDIGSIAFGQYLSAKLQNSASSSGSGTTASDLTKQVTQALENGASLQQVIQSLAQALGSGAIAQIKAQLGLDPGADAQTTLSKLLAQALWPPGLAPPGTAAQQAAALVGRLTQVANAMTRVINDAAGQQHDSLGTVSDANAGGNPAPNGTNAILQSVLAAFSSSTHGGTQSVLQSLASDGRTVATQGQTLVGTGGDTAIGRMLARAANVAVTQTVASDAPVNAASLLQGLAVGAAGSATNGATTDALIAQLLGSLQKALADVPAQSNGSNAGDSSTASQWLASLGLGQGSTTASTSAVTTPQAQTQVPSSYVDPNGILDQILQGISMRTLADGTQSVRLRLVPASLGDLTVNLQVQGGAVSASLVAQNADVRDTLLANQQLLMRSLADAGLKLSSFTVSLANNGTGYRHPENSNQPRFGTTRRFTGVSADAGIDAVSPVPTFGPSASQLAAMQWLNALA
ncbi:MAG: flagellar hook-length control protein FliK [Candidatus Eremiobacteraeota bacterium]|nr:flagellar hook-length control protein FliK [Candidatus Eremiobacteraeota bacterium]